MVTVTLNVLSMFVKQIKGLRRALHVSSNIPIAIVITRGWGGFKTCVNWLRNNVCARDIFVSAPQVLRAIQNFDGKVLMTTDKEVPHAQTQPYCGYRYRHHIGHFILKLEQMKLYID